MKDTIYRDLGAHLAPGKNRLPFLLARNDRQRDYLKDWLSSAAPVRSTDRKDAPPAAPVVEEPETIEQLNQVILDCGRCPGAGEKKCGAGSGENGAMIILNAPSMISSFEKKQFKTESVELLRKMLAAIDLEFKLCYITNLLKCEPSEALHRPSTMFVECQHILKKELELIRPRVVMVFGEIIPLQKIVHESEGISWFTIDHPITLIKNPDLKRKAWNTLQLVKAEMNRS